MPKSLKREEVLRAAERLFYHDGYHATGIDKILEEANTARMTLYKHFKSKDELLLAVLRRRSEAFRTWLQGSIESRAAEPAGRLLALFDALEDWFATEEFAGCSFINATAEFADAETPPHQVAAAHKRMLRRYLGSLARASGATSPDELAAELLQLADGAIVTAQVTADPRAAARAKAMAERAIQAHCGAKAA